MPVSSVGRYKKPCDGEVECFVYCDSESYSHNSTVFLHISGNPLDKSCRVMVERETGTELGRALMLESLSIPVGHYMVPDDAYERGCHWPVAYSFPVMEDWPSGFYIVTVSCSNHAPDSCSTHTSASWEAFFVVRPHESKNIDKNTFLLVLSTNTWVAYNNFGGASSYEGGPNPDRPIGPEDWTCPLSHHMRGVFRLSMIERPMMRGIISPDLRALGRPQDLREGYPEHVRFAFPNLSGESHGRPHTASSHKRKYDEMRNTRFLAANIAVGAKAQAASKGEEDALTSRYSMSTGWAHFERHFFIWAVKSGYDVHMISNRDLHLNGSDLINRYKCICIVGHDEYWTWEMRDVVDAYVAQGGNVARLAGNFMWQVRLEDGDSEGRSATHQVCYKYAAPSCDPYSIDFVGPKAVKGKHSLTTFCWDSLKYVGRPGCLSFGLNASEGIYVRTGYGAPRHCAGFTVYRPDHWIFKGTELEYGDTFGSEKGVLAFEVDGLCYQVQDGLPWPQEGKGCSSTSSIQILAMALAGNILSPREIRFVAQCRYGNDVDAMLLE